ncbi:hypothetical protein [Peribacillus frigoritolerans]|uniref:hypothetical protein n=1 Tax=Peribacillus frigoritolerans TaxID=450367 RepID=UPI003D9FCDB6
MKFTLLDNGADSLKGVYESLEKFDNNLSDSYHHIKDAVIFLNHGIEILFKVILSNHSAALMFTEIKSYQEARAKMKKSGKSNVFEVDSNLKTVSLIQAMDRIEYLCDIEIPELLRNSIYFINKTRNQIMHFGIELSKDDVKELVKKLKYCHEESILFLELHIDDLSDAIEDSRFEYTREDYESDMGEWQAELMMEEAKLGYDY